MPADNPVHNDRVLVRMAEVARDVAALERQDLADSYAESIDFTQGRELLAYLQTSDLSNSDRWAFRGQAPEWGLTTTIERALPQGARGERSFAERRALNEFKRGAHHYVRELPGPDEDLEWLSLMQHHGAPTRLLDWTKSPYVAAFFAVAARKPEAPGVIWAVDCEAIQNGAVELLNDARALLEDGRNAPPNLINPGLLRTGERFGEMFLGGGVYPIVATVEPYRRCERQVIQQGVFLCSSGDWGFETCFKYVLRRVQATRGIYLRKLVIAAEARDDLLGHLFRMNISEATLFPGLDGFARSLVTRESVERHIFADYIAPGY